MSKISEFSLNKFSTEEELLEKGFWFPAESIVDHCEMVEYLAMTLEEDEPLDRELLSSLVERITDNPIFKSGEKLPEILNKRFSDNKKLAEEAHGSP